MTSTLVLFVVLHAPTEFDSIDVPAAANTIPREASRLSLPNTSLFSAQILAAGAANTTDETQPRKLPLRIGLTAATLGITGGLMTLSILTRHEEASRTGHLVSLTLLGATAVFAALSGTDLGYFEFLRYLAGVVGGLAGFGLGSIAVALPDDARPIVPGVVLGLGSAAFLSFVWGSHF
jgi:hypothetical protein